MERCGLDPRTKVPAEPNPARKNPDQTQLEMLEFKRFNRIFYILDRLVHKFLSNLIRWIQLSMFPFKTKTLFNLYLSLMDG